MMVDVRPWPKAFRPPPEALPPQQQDGSGGHDGSNGELQAAQRPRCVYYMGLSKKKVSEARRRGWLGWWETGHGGRHKSGF